MSLAGAADALSGMGLLPGSRDVLLVDMASYRPPDELRMVMKELKNVGRTWKLYMPETERLATKVLEKSGLSPNATYLPPAVHPCHTPEPSASHGNAHYEAEMVMIGAVRELLDKTGTQPSEVDILITCASIWCATPSQSAMLVNHFGFREDVAAYHLGGMGCATGVLLMALVQDMLRAHPNSRLLFVASETTSFAFYPGMEVSRRVSNVIFRMGGTAVLFSNRRADAGRAKYLLQHHVRFHTSADDAAYRCISWSPDEEGHVGVYLGKDVVEHAGAALTLALTAISPKIMSWSQLAAGALNLLQRKVLGMPGVKPYTPDFGKCVDYFLIHAGGYAVLKGIQAGMKLPAAAMLPSFAALRDYGNTSASTTWYSFTYLESCVGVARGQRIMQIGCGGGMKVSIAIWRCLRDVRDNHKAWRHLTAPLIEEDLPRSISQADKLAAALKAGANAAPAAAPAAAAKAAAEKAAAAADSPAAAEPAAVEPLPVEKCNKPAPAAVPAGKESSHAALLDIEASATAAAGEADKPAAGSLAEAAAAPAGEEECVAAAEGEGLSDAAAAGQSEPWDSASSAAGLAASDASDVDDDKAAAASSSATSSSSGDTPQQVEEEEEKGEQQLQEGSAPAHPVLKFDDDPEEYEFHL